MPWPERENLPGPRRAGTLPDPGPETDPSLTLDLDDDTDPALDLGTHPGVTSDPGPAAGPIAPPAPGPAAAAVARPDGQGSLGRVVRGAGLSAAGHHGGLGDPGVGRVPGRGGIRRRLRDPGDQDGREAAPRLRAGGGRGPRGPRGQACGPASPVTSRAGPSGRRCDRGRGFLALAPASAVPASRD